ncbi:uncharacterized protein Z519_01087 [Cladophialophora bantiana CBS 173.52]|uniref:Azaphilone pigments biosynthesis cluster protein L N-terminal domain-containing protein n=1 Tax=Cladophialophora bantiana (strain ATCC 10958 / CBS 173.52 / CDC B-1940 / NIH 8579) TaxID=1442370 RepID=A0A0D2HVZ6_CLAB1|nr:uncharacterized protein Z519_01087 [Cladophialophora bantiana CBS 173.52]KIW97503.1 hypothetical protein Z519_01087 [Cladophialophora bantiana CBS 173.52]
MSGVEGVFGIAASGAGLLSLSIQLFESAAKLQRIYHAARDAPRTISRLLFGLETMAMALRQLEQYRQQRTASDALLARCIVECELHICEIRQLIDKMDDRLSKAAKISGRLYAAFKHRDVKELLDGLEKAKSSLELAYMMYLNEELRRRDQAYADMLAPHGALINGLQAQISAANASLLQQLTLLTQSSTLSPHHRPIMISPAQTNIGSGPIAARAGEIEMTKGSDVLAIDQAKGAKGKNTKPRLRATFRFPRWLTARVFDFAVTQAQWGWSIHLQTFHNVPHDSPIFHYCRNGSLEGIRRLIESGKATPLDAIYDGYSGVGGWLTVIEVAAERGSLELCQYLLGQTKWPDHGTRLSRALELFSLYNFSSPQPAEMYRLFMADPDFDADLDNSFQYEWLRNCKETESLEVILQNQFSGFDCRPLEMRFELASQLDDIDAAGFLRCVGLQARDRRLASLKNSKGRTVLHCVASNFEKHPEWFHVGLGALENGADPSSVAVIEAGSYLAPVTVFYPHYYPEGWQVTPLQDLLLVRKWKWESWFRSAVHKIHTWAEMIQRAGLDLCEYGTKETEIWRSLGVQGSCRSEAQGGEMMQLVYGPTPADWSLKICEPWTINVYRLQLPPGAFSDEPRLPTEIVWSPGDGEEDEGPWIHVERKERVMQPVDLRDLVFNQREPFIDLVDGSQDDSGAIMLMQHKASRVADGRIRSHSQPPRLRRREVSHYKVHFPLRSRWLSFHLCPADSRWRSGCAEGHFEGPWLLGGNVEPHVNVRSCFKHASRRPRSVQQTLGWRYFSFLAEIINCQDGASSYSSPGKLEGLRHTYTRDCPRGCRNVDVGRLNVPQLLRNFHPFRQHIYEDERGFA